VITGLFPQMYGNDKYDIDDSWQPRASVWTLEGTKGGKTYEWGPPPKIFQLLGHRDRKPEANIRLFITFRVYF
jgi:hypothetical protein